MINSFLNVENFSIFKIAPGKKIQLKSTFLQIQQKDEKYILPLMVKLLRKKLKLFQTFYDILPDDKDLKSFLPQSSNETSFIIKFHS